MGSNTCRSNANLGSYSTVNHYYSEKFRSPKARDLRVYYAQARLVKAEGHSGGVNIRGGHCIKKEPWKENGRGRSLSPPK